MIREAAELGRLWFDRSLDAQVPRGDGRPVVVIPGLFGGDLYLEPLRAWLRRIGYSATRSTLTVNAGCPLRLRDHVQSQIASYLREPNRLALVGHSRGGVIAWSIAAQMADRVSHLAVLGSPLALYRESAASGQIPHPPTYIGRLLRETSDFARRVLDPECHFPTCNCSFMQDVRRSLHPATAFLAIISRQDEVVPPEAATIPGAQILEVGGGHGALVYNTEVYRALAHFLAA
jgi:pimeloyl-ACP methyl ester carboxylesterase